MTTKEKVISLINYANETTGESDADLTNCVKSLVDGYGGGGSEKTYVGTYTTNYYCRYKLSDTSFITESAFYLNPSIQLNINVVPNYQSYNTFEWNIEFSLKSKGYTICLLGSKDDYYSNPSIEIQGYNKVWFGFSQNASTWSFGKTFDFDFETNERYSIKLGYDGEKVYCRIYKADSMLHEETIETVEKPQTSTTKNPVFLNNGGQSSRYAFDGEFFLGKCYFKADGEILWGEVT